MEVNLVDKRLENPRGNHVLCLPSYLPVDLCCCCNELAGAAVPEELCCRCNELAGAAVPVELCCCCNELAGAAVSTFASISKGYCDGTLRDATPCMIRNVQEKGKLNSQSKKKKFLEYFCICNFFV